MKKAALLPYPVEVFEDSASGGYIALVPKLTGCKGSGKSREEAVAAAGKAARAWLENARREGRPIPEPERVSRLNSYF